MNKKLKDKTKPYKYKTIYCRIFLKFVFNYLYTITNKDGFILK